MLRGMRRATSGLAAVATRSALLLLTRRRFDGAENAGWLKTRQRLKQNGLLGQLLDIAKHF